MLELKKKLKSELKIINKSSDNLNQNNQKIMKLIRSKIYPLHKSNSLKMLFPQIKKSNKNFLDLDKIKKKYIQIQVKDDENSNMIEHTDFQQEYRYQMEKKNRNSNFNIKLKNKKEFNIIDDRRIRHTIEYEKNNINITQILENQCLFNKSHRQDINLKQEDNNKRYLNRIKDNIKQSKIRYLNTIKISSQSAQISTIQKKNCSFQYLVNQIQLFGQENIKKGVISAYEAISPNKISKFLELFQKNQTNRSQKIQQQLAQQRIQQKQVKGVRFQGKKATKFFRSQDDNQTQMFSAKLRLKGNHKRMIELINK